MYNLKILSSIDDNKYKRIVIVILYNLKIKTSGFLSEHNDNPNKNINFQFMKIMHNKITSIIDAYNVIRNN